ncbi:MAG: cyclase family protein [Deltaproteobacteria bacterium]|nr:cyclase family protein [Deltaproteobacteria bacterium]
MNEKSADIDEVGATKFLTPEVIKAAVGLVKLGKVYPLGQVLEPGIPQLAHHPAFVRTPLNTPYQSQLRWRERGANNEPGAASERLEINGHTGTHIDALGHWSNCNRIYGGLDARENFTEKGLVHLGLEHCPPIVTRGILLDIARLKGVEMLEGGTAIAVQDFQAFLEQARLKLRQGDVALLYTGWSKLWEKRDPRYCTTEPGPGRDAAVWLAEQGIVALGTDTMAVDVDPPEDPAYPRMTHQTMLVERGVHLIENMYLEELAKDKVYEFLLVALTPKLKGGSGFPIEPVAII